MKNTALITFIFIVLFAGGYVFLQKVDESSPQTIISANSDIFFDLCGPQRPSSVPIEIGSLTIYADIACTDEEQMRGLSGLERLALGTGMLFPFAEAGAHSIWMKDMSFSLDMVWISEDGTIVHIEERVSPESFPATFSSPTPSRYVLEINSGVISSAGVSVGDKVAILPR